eukprot:c34720_g1_i1.p2 GENE.c34720_g1_i1~~c34720_g1_i1.p2  ORF type:complete len:114 (-),score=24.30 c34720_g1_i1:40-381(-)
MFGALRCAVAARSAAVVSMPTIARAAAATGAARWFSDKAAPLNGTVKWFDARKGFGFLASTEGGPDVFAHFSAIRGPSDGMRTLVQNQKVQYEIADGPKGKQAVNIRVIEEAA